MGAGEPCRGGERVEEEGERDEIKIECGTKEVMGAIRHPKLERRGDFFSGNIVNLAPNANIRILNDGIFHIVSFLVVEFHHFFLFDD